MPAKTKDPIGDRMKGSYENRTRHLLPRRTYTILRLDGVSWHTWANGLRKPFDSDLIQDLNDAVKDTLPRIQGARFAFVQSDEISILMTDFEEITSDAWFDGNLQKITTVAASLLTANFNALRAIRSTDRERKSGPAFFDCRAFTIPDRDEVANCFIWRQQDCIRNSLSMVAQSLYSHRELTGKNGADLHEMLHDKGVNWAHYEPELKNGRLVCREKYQHAATPGVERSHWVVRPAWKFTGDRERLMSLIPQYP